MIGKKGQAFDTFKLMIAAVVAVAILGILLSILSGISVPNDPASITNQQLAKAYQYKGSTFVSQSEANFQSGVVYSGESFKQSVGGVATITFECAGTYDATMCTGGASLAIGQNFKATISACCNTNGDECNVGIGTQVTC